jgi:hypothetical protein
MSGWGPPPERPRPPVPGWPAPSPEQPVGAVVVRTYSGRTQADASVLYQADVGQMVAYGYFPVSQSWADGRAGIARWAVIGVAALAIKPKGTLTVTYVHR